MPTKKKLTLQVYILAYNINFDFGVSQLYNVMKFLHSMCSSNISLLE